MATPGPSLDSLSPESPREEMLAALNTALAAMDSDDFQFELEDMPQEERTQAVRRRGEIHRLRTKLINQTAADLLEQFKGNEPELLEATRALQASASRLEKVSDVMDTAGAFLRIAIRVMGPL